LTQVDGCIDHRAGPQEIQRQCQRTNNRSGYITGKACRTAFAGPQEKLLRVSPASSARDVAGLSLLKYGVAGLGLAWIVW
jgi:hypothetical protein